ncbi:hypothetical protein BD310DRAFT_940620 [Dichomitus squalens]|uniref:Uncharacterized protein n=1 Tax=Dichomitus squalens TaxID=114155 RepID=A0A4Q9PBV9_9APHY|nr:hypothetical protein BD310DRAFT_940620 [Dichomitus squalens]
MAELALWIGNLGRALSVFVRNVALGKDEHDASQDGYALCVSCMSNLVFDRGGPDARDGDGRKRHSAGYGGQGLAGRRSHRGCMRGACAYMNEEIALHRSHNSLLLPYPVIHRWLRSPDPCPSRRT